MPAEPIELPITDRLEMPRPDWVAEQPRLSVNLGLRQIMLALIYFAVLSVVGRRVYENQSLVAIALLGFLVGGGVCYLGLWLSVRLGELGFIGWTVFVIGFAIATGSVLHFFAIPAVLVLIGVIFYLHVQHRRHQQTGLLWVLAMAADRQMPLAAGVEAYSQQNRGIFQARAHALATLLQRGKSLSESIGWVAGIVPWDAPLLIRIAEQTGQLARGLREAAETRSRRHHALRDVFGRIAYLIWVVTTAEGIVGFNSYFILPKFEAIFKDFGVSLPVATVWLIQSSRSFAEYSFLIGVAQLVFLVYLILAVGNGGLQGLPILGRLFRLRHKALLLRSLALVVDAGQPLDRAFATLASYYPTRRNRRRLIVASEAVQAGASWTDSLRQVGLITASDMGVLDAATRAGNLGWALRALAETGERRFAYRLQIGSHVAFIVALLSIGLLVLLIAVALFSPLIQLIEKLSS